MVEVELVPEAAALLDALRADGESNGSIVGRALLALGARLETSPEALPPSGKLAKRASSARGSARDNEVCLVLDGGGFNPRSWGTETSVLLCDASSRLGALLGRDPSDGALIRWGLAEALRRRIEREVYLIERGQVGSMSDETLHEAFCDDESERLLRVLKRSVATPEHRHNPLIPLWKVRRGAAMSSEWFDALILRLERARKVVLKIANDPQAVEHPESGIRIEGRGLLYYAILPEAVG